MADEPLHDSADLGLDAVERALEVLTPAGPGWAVREDRGFTWWPHRLRQRVWAEPATTTPGGPAWQVRSRTPLFRDVADEAAAHEILAAINGTALLGAAVYEPADGTISLRTGAFLAGEGARIARAAFVFGTRLAAAVGSVAVNARPAEGPAPDEEPHPEAGWRADPDPVLATIQGMQREGAVLPRPAIRAVARAARARGLAVKLHPDGDGFDVMVSTDRRPTMATLRNMRQGLYGPGLMVRLAVSGPFGRRGGASIANALNLAEQDRWTGDERAQPWGAWHLDGSTLVHLAFTPAALLGRLSIEDARHLIDGYMTWTVRRDAFVAERLPWLETAAADRWPDDEPEPAAPPPDEDADEPAVPFAERGFGPAARTARSRSVGDPAAPRTGRTLVVDPGDAAGFGEIDDAVAAAEDFDVIRVRPGTYRRPVVVDRAVTIEGDGPVEEIVLEPVGGECLGVAASGGTVRGLTIRPARAGNDGTAHSAVAVHDVSVTLEGCHLSTHLGATVWVGGRSSLAVLRDCTIADGAQNPVYATEGGRVELARCRLTGNAWPATANGLYAWLRVTDSVVVDNLSEGLHAMEDGRLEVTGTTVSGNAGTGVGLIGSAAGSAVTGCTIERNGGAGILIAGGRGVRLADNRLRGNDAGIVIDRGANPVVETNDLADHRTVGIGVTGEGTSPIVRGNAIATAAAPAIVVRGGATGLFERNHVTAGSAPGARILDEATAPAFLENVLGGGRDVGIEVGDGAGGRYEANDLRGNAEGSWRLEDEGEVVRSGNLEDTGRRTGDPDTDAGPRAGRMN